MYYSIMITNPNIVMGKQHRKLATPDKIPTNATEGPHQKRAWIEISTDATQR